ncbi:MAG: ABC transporter substrate-binding protein [Candidatus Poseidoniaceae archaeon]|jgi:1,4-dihydroxy-6-naphthoate synthase|nr:ABC transporter substrate-binding protein [Candidatus Poseidoniaceae archaeon]
MSFCLILSLFGTYQNRLLIEGQACRTDMSAHLPQDEAGNSIVRIGHSPDPDDAFMFHAMTNGKFPTPGYKFVHELQDIETLNHRAINKELEVSAVSIHAYPDIAENYALMNCGASMGEGYGPMIVCRKGTTIEHAKKSVIAVPGMKTSAYLGLRLAWGEVDVEVLPFDHIIPAILDGKYESGLIIHEGQLTYVEHDLEVLIDLGKWWNAKTDNYPMPLGGNVVRRDLGQKAMEDITMYTKMSIEYAIENPEEALEFAKKWGRGIDDETNQKFVSMYVNQRTIDYGDDGRASIRQFIKEGQDVGLIDKDFNIDIVDFIGRG